MWSTILFSLFTRLFRCCVFLSSVQSRAFWTKLTAPYTRIQHCCPYNSAQTSTCSRKHFNCPLQTFFHLATCVLACSCHILSENLRLSILTTCRAYHKYRFPQTDLTLLCPCSSRLFNSLVVTSMQSTSIFDPIHVLSALQSSRKEHICKDTWQLAIAHQHHPPHKFRDHGLSYSTITINLFPRETCLYFYFLQVSSFFP